ncbi:glycosyltransferase family protein [Agrococcus carbonis]|uniref:Glycosyl transferases group 1 n=1 Tax=Agrococcus carbonis TaxID=684552 RepID=A0A1H1RFM9_9MICO|nr:glycosyltransferase [Agrococcus carbonis]SDS34597.1 Glycosyl transferases group 1 [Agrococcus carbonis]
MPLVTVSSYGPAGSSARVRLFDWLAHLGIPHASHTYLGGRDNRLGSIAAEPRAVLRAEAGLRALVRDVPGSTLVMSRRASPFSRGGVEARLLAAADHGVYDFDDAIQLPRHDLAGRLFAPHRQWRRAVEAADTVIAGNDWLAEAAARHASHVVVVPSCVEPDRYTRKTTYERAGAPRAIWLGSPSTEPYLRSIAQPLLTAHEATGMRLTVVSAGRASLGAIDAIVDRVDWHEATYAAELAAADFGIMPLTDEPWSLGKCAYKLLQYGASALPMVGSPVGANAQALARAGGFAPTSPQDWSEALVAMARLSPVEAERLGARARRAIDEHYSFAAWSTAWRSAVGVADAVR